MNPSVAVAISAFRSDAAVISLLESIFANPHSDVGPVIVVDSLGSGRIAEIAQKNNWQIQYNNSPVNLGSAGNLAARLELSAKTGAAWCLCLNHDASWEADRLSAMLAAATSMPRVGAVYPMLDHSPREPRWEDGRRNFRPSAGTRLRDVPTDGAIAEVLWSSSNSALYSLAPFSENVSVMSELWMGYEDLAYGIALNRGGWIQMSCREARLHNVFDYTPRKLLGRTMHIPDKPAWYMYYNIRNLILIRRSFGKNKMPVSVIAAKFFQSAIRVILMEDKKRMRLKMLLEGVFDGLRGRGGKGRLP